MTDPSQSSQQTTSRDPDLVNAEIALKRAAMRARERAKIKGTGIVISENGVITEIRPEPIEPIQEE